MPRPPFAITDLKLSALPLLVTFLLGMGVPQLGLPVRWLLGRIASPDQLAIYPWLYLYAGHTGQLLGALACIAVMRRFIPGHYGLRLPRRKSYIGTAVAWGIAFGVAMTLVDYAPEISEHAAPKGFYPLTRVNILGWLSFEALFVGFPEEILFRGLLVTYLMAKVPGRVRLFQYQMSVAGVLVALIFALAHVTNFWVRPFWLALGQQVYAFALAILYAYWYEKSESLLAPIIGHNLSDGVEYALTLTLVALWS